MVEPSPDTWRIRRPARTGAALALVLAVALAAVVAGCSDETGGSAGGADGATGPCEAWQVVETEPADTADGVARLVAALDDLEATAPDELVFEAHLYGEAAVAAGAVLAEAGYDPAGLAALSEERRQEGAQASDLLANLPTSDLAFWVHEQCPGSRDPAFILPCPAVPADDGSVAPTPPGPAVLPATGPDDPVAAARAQVGDVAGAVALVHRTAADGAIEMAFVDDEGRAVRLRRHEPLEDGGWDAGADWVCEAPAAEGDPTAPPEPSTDAADPDAPTAAPTTG